MMSVCLAHRTLYLLFGLLTQLLCSYLCGVISFLSLDSFILFHLGNLSYLVLLGHYCVLCYMAPY